VKAFPLAGDARGPLSKTLEPSRRS
jgi:hypothetical protein